MRTVSEKEVRRVITNEVAAKIVGDRTLFNAVNTHFAQFTSPELVDVIALLANGTALMRVPCGAVKRFALEGLPGNVDEIKDEVRRGAVGLLLDGRAMRERYGL